MGVCLEDVCLGYFILLHGLDKISMGNLGVRLGKMVLRDVDSPDPKPQLPNVSV